MTPRPPTTETPTSVLNSNVPNATELTRSEQPGGTQEMPSSSRARKLRDESNSTRDSNDLGSGVST